MIDASTSHHTEVSLTHLGKLQAARHQLRVTDLRGLNERRKRCRRWQHAGWGARTRPVKMKTNTEQCETVQHTFTVGKFALVRHTSRQKNCMQFKTPSPNAPWPHPAASSGVHDCPSELARRLCQQCSCRQTTKPAPIAHSKAQAPFDFLEVLSWLRPRYVPITFDIVIPVACACLATLLRGRRVYKVLVADPTSRIAATAMKVLESPPR
mmetsp:Transcript_13347/g.31841  ORF Transcript_13347/g.31841 Transcript_13347/m.31841 type:complete len:210 (-) Transcript_13347:864-1493(-)